MNTWSAAFLIARKDLNLYRRDRTGLLLGLLLPIVLVAVFGSVMKFAFGGDGGMPRVAIWVCDEDKSEASQKFVAALREVSMLSVRPGAKRKAPLPRRHSQAAAQMRSRLAAQMLVRSRRQARIRPSLPRVRGRPSLPGCARPSTSSRSSPSLPRSR